MRWSSGSCRPCHQPPTGHERAGRCPARMAHWRPDGRRIPPPGPRGSARRDSHGRLGFAGTGCSRHQLFLECRSHALTCWPMPARRASSGSSIRQRFIPSRPARADQPADESTAWNLERSGFSLHADQADRRAIGPGSEPAWFHHDRALPRHGVGPARPQTHLDQGGSDNGSARAIAFLPSGGIPIIDAAVVALAHRRALISGGESERYAVVGPYLSYPEMARIVAAITGRPSRVISIPDRMEHLDRAGVRTVSASCRCTAAQRLPTTRRRRVPPPSRQRRPGRCLLRPDAPAGDRDDRAELS